MRHGERANAAIAEGYDQVPYDPPGDLRLAPDRLAGIATLYGMGRRINDVLDLGCGTGAQLARAGQDAPGRLVGVDLSLDACAKAADRCGPFGARAQIHCADLIDVDAGDLGEFDLIYVIGALYIVPQSVRDHILKIISAVLRPGGLAVISYHAGPLAGLKADIARLLRAGVPMEVSASQKVVAARANLQAIRQRLAPPTGSLLATTLDGFAIDDDGVIYHEVFNANIEPLRTWDLLTHLKPAGFDFVDYLGATPLSGVANPDQRAIEAGLLDLSGGGYRHAIFGRSTGVAQAADFGAPGLVWGSGASAVGESAAGRYALLAGGSVTVHDPTTRAAMAILAEGPVEWSELLARTAARRPEAAAAADFVSRLTHDLQLLWQARAISPLMTRRAGSP